MQVCPCGSGLGYLQCCQPLVAGQHQAKNAEQLMRSRFSAFVFDEYQYLWYSHHPEFREAQPSSVATGQQWQKLEIILSCEPSPEHAIVEFKAYYLEAGKVHLLHERSNFINLQGEWKYTNGEFNPKPPSKNGPCLCNSGKKFKQCCGKH